MILLTCAVVLTFLTTGSVSGQANVTILDITHEYVPDMPSFGSVRGLGFILRLVNDMRNNSQTNNSELKMNVHSGTHVDAPSHVYEEYYDAAIDVNTLDLQTLNGPAILAEVPRNSNISAVVLQNFNIPRGVKRVLFRTLNTDRRLMFKKEFDSSYVGFTEDGAQWLVDNTDIKLVGVDYLSSAAYSSLIIPHRILLKNKDIVIVEGLKLDEVKPQVTYNLHCLPLRLHADASPTRCILIQ